MLDILLTVQEDPASNNKRETPKAEEKTEEITWKSYNCVQCTFINDTNPLSMCCMCGFAAPDSAKIVTKI
jgi:anaerobic ribonucleoside-triphosphate reductase